MFLKKTRPQGIMLKLTESVLQSIDQLENAGVAYAVKNLVTLFTCNQYAFVPETG